MARELLLFFVCFTFCFGLRPITYTTQEDFYMGLAVNMDHEFQPGSIRLTLSPSLTSMWIPVSSAGYVAKLCTACRPYPKIVAMYKTSPGGAQNPSRIGIDSNANCWVGNRSEGSMTKIGMEETGQCVDRNGNGIIDTSRAIDEIMPWEAGKEPEDECILLYHKDDASINTDIRHITIDEYNNVYYMGRSLKHLRVLSPEGEVIEDYGVQVAGGYGGVYLKSLDPDKKGTIYSAPGSLYMWDLNLPNSEATTVDNRGYGIYGVCTGRSRHIWGTKYSNPEMSLVRFDPERVRGEDETGDMEIFEGAQGLATAQGCVVDHDNTVWVAHSLGSGVRTVAHTNPFGRHIGNIELKYTPFDSTETQWGEGPTGVSVDRDGYLFAICYRSKTIMRINPDLNRGEGAVDWVSPILPGSMYSYSDLTGAGASASPTSGSWIIVYDLGEGNEGAWWAQVLIDADLQEDSKLAEDEEVVVRVAASDDPDVFPASVNETRITEIQGRYIQVRVELHREQYTRGPVLHSVTIVCQGCESEEKDFPWVLFFLPYLILAALGGLAALGIIIANRKKPELAEEPTLAPVAMVDTPAAAPAAVAPIGKAKFEVKPSGYIMRGGRKVDVGWGDLGGVESSPHMLGDKKRVDIPPPEEETGPDTEELLSGNKKKKKKGCCQIL